MRIPHGSLTVLNFTKRAIEYLYKEYDPQYENSFNYDYEDECIEPASLLGCGDIIRDK